MVVCGFTVAFPGDIWGMASQSRGRHVCGLSDTTCLMTSSLSGSQEPEIDQLRFVLDKLHHQERAETRADPWARVTLLCTNLSGDYAPSIPDPTLALPRRYSATRSCAVDVVHNPIARLLYTPGALAHLERTSVNAVSACG